MRRARARSRETNRPEGVTFSFQVSLNKIEPSVLKRCFNLLAKNNCRTALADEAEPFRPQMAVVSNAFLITRRREGLAGARACPNRSVIGPSGKPERVRPDTDSCKEVALCITSEVVMMDIFDTPFVNLAICNMAGFDQIPQPLSGIRIYFIVIGLHATFSATSISLKSLP
jgi:hypothetical protein